MTSYPELKIIHDFLNPAADTVYVTAHSGKNFHLRSGVMKSQRTEHWTVGDAALHI